MYSSLLSMYFIWKKLHVTCAIVHPLKMWVVQVKQWWWQFENGEYAHETMVSIVLSVLVQQPADNG